MSLSQSQEAECQGPGQITDLETDGLEEAEKTWIKDPPPFIDYAIPDSIEPGDQLEVWKASDMGIGPRTSGPKTLITCRSWKNTNDKYWTCDGLKKNWRHIVGGLGVPNPNGWFTWVVWHGQEHGFTKARVLWTRLETQRFTPNVLPLQDDKVAGRTDQNHNFWQKDGTRAAAEKSHGTRSQSSLSIDDTPLPKRACTNRQREPSFYTKFQVLPREDDDDLPKSGPEPLGDVVHPHDESSQGSRPTEDNNVQNSGLEPFGVERHPDDESVQRLREPTPSSQLQGSSSIRANQLLNPRHKRNFVAPVAIMVAPAASSSPLSATQRKEMDDRDEIALRLIRQKKALLALDIEETEILQAQMERRRRLGPSQ